MHIAKVKMFLLRISYFEDDVFILENNMVCGLVCVCALQTQKDVLLLSSQQQKILIRL